MLKSILYTIAIAIFSALLVAYSYDIDNGEEIPLSSTKQGIQDMVVTLSRFLGIIGSWIVGIVATGSSLYSSIQHYRNAKKR